MIESTRGSPVRVFKRRATEGDPVRIRPKVQVGGSFVAPGRHSFGVQEPTRGRFGQQGNGKWSVRAVGGANAGEEEIGGWQRARRSRGNEQSERGTKIQSAT